MGFRCGIIGLPNVGKSTLFNALTKTSIAQAENYPFCTIEPNIGEVDVPDKRLEELSLMNSSKIIIPARLTFVDIAGLVEGASKGEGLGNKFLANIKEVDAIAHIVRCFSDKNISHINGEIDPIKDIEIINTELLLADIENLEKRIHVLEKKSRGSDKEAKEKLILIEKVLNSLNFGNPYDKKNLDEKSLKHFHEFNLLTDKKTLYVCNIGEDSLLNGNEFSKRVKKKFSKDNIETINISANIESQISSLPVKEQEEFLNSLKLSESGLNKLIKKGYQILNLITFFTSGPKETRAWTIKSGSLAPKAGGKIHSDFEKGFIRAETINYNDLIKEGSLTKAKESGKLRAEGQEYQIKDGDVLNFRFNV